MQKISYLLISFSLIFSSCSVRKNSTSGLQEEEKFVGQYGYFKKPLGPNYRITQRFKPKSNRKHKGVDLAGKKNSPIFATAKGRVVYVGRKFRGYGLMILMEHVDGFSSLYSHLNKAFVKSGQYVEKGHLLGGMGRTGRATGVHLHFELMKDKNPINPERFIKL